MYLKKLLLIAIVAITADNFLAAQDIHFTQFNMSPMTLNPANIGKFEGTVRIGGIYRSQWTSVLGKKQFETPSFWADAPIIRGFRKKDWLGVGLMVFQDNVGAGILKHNTGKLGAAYHLALDRKGNTYLSIGGHYGQESYSVNDENLRFEDGYVQTTAGGPTTYFPEYKIGNSVDNGRINNPKPSFSDIDAGVSLTSRLNKTMDIVLGFTVFHIGQPQFTLLTGGDNPTPGPGPNPPPTSGSFKQPRRFVTHGTFNIKTSERVTISPAFIFQTMAGQDEIMVQAMGGYLFDPVKDITLNAGLGYRLGDAANILVGAKVKDLRVGLAYDINTSGLKGDTRYRGGFELAANYIIRIYKKSVVKPKILCPRF